MHIYDTLIIGCGYTAVGFAVQRNNCIICERTELCDTHFYAALPVFEYHEYKAQTDEGKRLSDIYEELGLIKNGMMNAVGFESAFCKYISEKDIDILLKCRVVGIDNDNGIRRITVMTNSGLEAIFAKNVLDFQSSSGEYITALFVSNDITSDIEKLRSVFGDVRYERAFYDNRYAMFIPAESKDINMLKLDIYKKWKASETSARILHIPFSTFAVSDAGLGDDKYKNPVKAFEQGIKMAKELIR